MKNQKGFTILETLITMAIILLVLSAAYFTYVGLFREAGSEREKTEKEIEKIVGLEILRLDLEHLGYGVGIKSGSDYRIYDFDNKNKNSALLTIRSTLNNTNNKTIGWVMCDNGEIPSNLDKREDKSNNNIVYVNKNGYVSYVCKGKTCIDENNNSITIPMSKDCPSGDIFVGFPFNTKAKGCNFGRENFCNEIVYTLSKTDDTLPSNCAKDTHNLLRKVNDGTGEPVLSCVADVRITVDLDTNGDGNVDSYNFTDVNDSSGDLTPDKLRSQTKRINVYILYQVSKGTSKDYSFKNYQTDSNGNYMEIDGQKLYLPTNFQNYQWNVIKLSVKPMSIIK